MNRVDNSSNTSPEGVESKQYMWISHRMKRHSNVLTGTLNATRLGYDIVIYSPAVLYCIVLLSIYVFSLHYARAYFVSNYCFEVIMRIFLL